MVRTAENGPGSPGRPELAVLATARRSPAARRAPAHSADSVTTLAERIKQRDRDRFVGRDRELLYLESCLDRNPPASLVLLHGPCGIGKSTLLRELSRRAGVRGREVFWVDGGEFAAAPLSVEEALRPALMSECPLIVIDGFDHISVAGPLLRQTVLPSLADSAIVIIASRRTPERAWFSGGWECVTAELELGGIAAVQATELLRARGVVGPRAKAIVDRAGGSPLALGVAAVAGARWSSDELPGDPELLRPLVRQIAGNETSNVRPFVLAVAALCSDTTTDLLGTVAPECDAAEAMEQLRSLSFAEEIGGAIVLDDLARKVLAADLRRRTPELEHELRRRIADLSQGGGSAGRAAQVEMVTGTGPSQPIHERSCEAVRDALRNFGVPSELANNELACGRGIEERAQSVRGLLSSAVERAFGDTPNEQLLKRVLTCGYLEPRLSHEQCAWELHLSRAAYFRRLRAASDRLAEYVVTSGAASTSPVPATPAPNSALPGTARAA